MKQGSKKRSIEPITCDTEKMLKTLWREEKLNEFFLADSVEEKTEKKNQKGIREKSRRRRKSKANEKPENKEVRKEDKRLKMQE